MTTLLKTFKEKPPVILHRSKRSWMEMRRNRNDAIRKKMDELAAEMPTGYEISTVSFAERLGVVNRREVDRDRARSLIKERDDFEYDKKKGCYVKI